MDRSREDALRCRRERERERRASETPEQREARLSQRRLRDRERARQRRATETAEEREARLARGRVRSRARRGAESEEAGSNSFKAIRHAKLLPSPVRRERPAYSCYAFVSSLPLAKIPCIRLLVFFSCMMRSIYVRRYLDVQNFCRAKFYTGYRVENIKSFTSVELYHNT